jgi:hypothetical protein
MANATAPKQITIRGPSPELAQRLRALSEVRGESLNATILHLLEHAVGIDERRARLERWATWQDEDAADFDDALGAQRTIDDALWR